MYGGRRGYYSEFQCIMGNGHMGTPCEQIDTYESITFSQIRWRAVEITLGFKNLKTTKGSLQLKNKEPGHIEPLTDLPLDILSRISLRI